MTLSPPALRCAYCHFLLEKMCVSGAAPIHNTWSEHSRQEILNDERFEVPYEHHAFVPPKEAEEP
jgi:hypothetical protein